MRTITGNHQEFVIIGNFMRRHVWVSRNDLLFGGEICTLLEFEITKGTRKSQIAIDPAKIYETARSANPCFLAYTDCKKGELGPVSWRKSLTFVLRLVVEGKGFRPPLDA